MTQYYGMYTEAGNRLIHNRVETIRKKVNKIVEADYDSERIRKANIKLAILKGIESYQKMQSKNHGECHDTEVRNCFLCEMERIYQKATGAEQWEARQVIDELYD